MIRDSKVPPVMLYVSGGAIWAIVSDLPDDEVSGFMVFDDDMAQVGGEPFQWPPLISWQEFAADHPEEYEKARAGFAAEGLTVEAKAGEDE